jgi:hypothetical protein
MSSAGKKKSIDSLNTFLLFKELKKKKMFSSKPTISKSKQQFIHQFFSLFKNKWKKRKILN